jgi:hypothetical protein
MKLIEDIVNTRSQGVQESESYTIESSAKAFLVLSDRLYSNKILAVVRELSTNASESQIEAGNPETPFDVSLPNILNPNFVIRDYGLGLSHKDCMILYRTYFKSTKNENNNVGGCLGLGSKSPFAYTDSFSVISYFDGMKRFYSGVRTTNGPEFNFMHEEATDEPNGIEVSVPVKASDFESFRTSAASIYRHFDVKPNFIGKQVEIIEKQILLSDDSWYIDGNSSYNYIVMGQIAYPIKASVFDVESDIYGFLKAVSGLHIKMPIGSVDITPSREELSYNPQTINNIKVAVESIADYIDKKVEDDINSCSTLYEARIKYVDMDKLFTTGKKLLWKGQKLFDDNRDFTICPNTESLTSATATYRRKGVNFYPAEKLKFGYNCAYVFEDITTYKKSRIQKLLRNCGNVYIYKGNKSDFLKLLGDIPEDKIMLMSNLPYDVNISNGGGSIPCSMYDEGVGGFVDSKMSVKYADAIYIPESRGWIHFRGRRMSLSQMANLIKHFEEVLGYDFGGTFYTVKPSTIENSGLKNRYNWKSLETVFEEAFQYVVDTEKEKFKIAANEPSFRNVDIAKTIISVNKDVEISAMIKDYYDRMAEYNKAVAYLEKFKNVTNYLGMSREVNDDLPNYNEKFDKILKDRYPCAKNMSYYSKDVLVPYIKDMDELNEFRRNSKILQDNFVQTVLN